MGSGATVWMLKPRAKPRDASVSSKAYAGTFGGGALYITDPRAGLVRFLPLCGPFIGKIARASASTKATYRSNFSNPAVTKLLEDSSVAEVARMDDEVKTLLNVTLGPTATTTGGLSAVSSPAPLTSACGRAPSHGTSSAASS